MNHINQMQALQLIAHNKISEVEKLLDTIDELNEKIHNIPVGYIMTLIDYVKSSHSQNQEALNVANTVAYWTERL